MKFYPESNGKNARDLIPAALPRFRGFFPTRSCVIFMVPDFKEIKKSCNFDRIEKTLKKQK